MSRILKNEKYTGLWIWRKWKNVRDPMTGRIKKVARIKKEQLTSFKENLAIIDKNIWEKAQKRWQEINGTWPVRKQNNKIKQKSYVQAQPTHLLSGLLKCNQCQGAIVLICGKGGGYYGCYNAQRKTCDNKLLITRNKIEKTLLLELKNNLLTAENLQYVYKNLEKLINKSLDDSPEIAKKKKAQHEKLSLEIQNYLNYIKMGNISKAVSAALKDAETKSEGLNQEIASLEFQKKNTFQVPPKEWIDHRLENLHTTLSKNTDSSALALKNLLGTIRLEPIADKDEDIYSIINDGEYAFKPYYIAHTKINTLTLLDDRDKGANWYQWRTQLQPIRTASEIIAHIKILPIQPPLLYQKVAQKANQLRLLGMSYQQIAKSLQVSRKTVLKALNHLKRGGK